MEQNVGTKAIKQSAAIYLRRTFERLNAGNPIEIDLAVIYLKGILEAVSDNLPPEVIDNLSSSLFPLVSPSEGGHPQYTCKLLEAVYPTLKELTQRCEVLTSFRSFFVCIGQIIGVMIDYKDLQANALELLAMFGKLVLNLLSQLILFSKKTIDNKGESFSTDIAEIIPKINTIKEWLRMSLVLFIKSKQSGVRALIEYFIFSQDATVIMEQCIKYVAIVGSQRQDTVRSSTGFGEFDDSVNGMKEKALSLANSMLEYVYHTFYSAKMPNSPLFNLCKTVGPFALFSLTSLCVSEHDSLEKLLDHDVTSDLVVGFLRFLSNLLEDHNFYGIFSQYKEKLVVDVVLVLMRTTLKEKGWIVSDPENFVNLALDTCDKQESEVCKTEAAKLLEALCDHVDGCLTFTSSFCCEAFRFGCNGAVVEQLSTSTILSPFATSSPFLTKSTAEYIVDTTMMAMTDISYLTPRRKDVLENFQRVLEENLAVLTDSTSTLIRCRFALMIGYYAENLFPHSQEQFIKMIEFLIKGLSQEHEEKALALQCADTLKSIIADQDMIVRLEMYINKLLPYFIAMVGSMQLPSFFDILKSVVNSYSQAIDETVINLIQALASRIENEYKALRAKGEKINMIINQCWNVIRTVCDDNSFFPEYLEGIETSMLPLFNYLVDPANIDFDEELLQVISTLIKRRHNVSENMAKILPYLQKLYEKNKGLYTSLLQVLNNYIFYGRDLFASNKALIDLVLNMAHGALFSSQQPIEVNASEGAILCQIVFQNLGNGILDTYLPPLIGETLKRFDVHPVPPVLILQLYNVILCAACNNGAITLKTLEDHGKTEAILMSIFKDAPRFRTTYDRKVLAIGLSNIIFTEGLPPSITKHIPKALEVIVTTLQAQAAEETKRLLKSDKKAIKLEDNDESSESENEEEMMESDKPRGEEKKAKEEESEGTESESEDMPKDPEETIAATLETIQGQIKKIDEYSYVGTVIKMMYRKHPEATQMLVASLNEMQQNYLKNIMQSKRITTQRKGERLTVARRIVKPKHKLTKLLGPQQPSSMHEGA